MSMVGPGVQAQIDSAGVVHDSYLVAVAGETLTVGKDWVQITGLMEGPQNFDVRTGRDVEINADGDAIDVLMKGRYYLYLNCQFTAATGDGYFEGAVEPNGLSLASWPTDLVQGHDGRNLSAATIDWDDANPGFQIGYQSPQLSVGATITAWARYASASGSETVDIAALVYITKTAR